MTYDLSIIMPSRNEMFTARTVEDILEHKRGNTQVIVGLDGAWSDPGITDHPDVVILHYSESIGQRAISNKCVALSTAKYIMKVDAHCAFDEGFDVKMMSEMHDDWTMAPLMKNLHAFDWVCPEGHRRYQGPSGPCQTCGKETVRDVVWIAKDSPKSTSYRFDTEMHFQYWGEWAKQQSGDIVETLSLQGSAFMCTREKYLELDLCSEQFHSWGQQGVEVACKTWLSGGSVMVNKNTWYAHMFRTQGGDFSFPYHQPQDEVKENREISRQLFRNDTWPKATRKFQWLLDKFNPPGWGGIQKGIIYYTDGELPEKMLKACQKQIRKVANLPIVTCALKHRSDFGYKNIYFPKLKRGFPTLFKQILAGLEHTTADIVFFCEHDVLYSKEHFDFVPPSKDKFYYNHNWWKVREDGHALHFEADQLSGLCCYRDLALQEVRKIVEQIDKEGFSMKEISFEPGSRDGRAEAWNSEVPIIDLRHGKNATKNRWSQEGFRDQSTCQGWKECEFKDIQGWDFDLTSVWG